MLLPSPPPVSSSSGPGTQQAGKRALRAEAIPSAVVPVKEEAVVADAAMVEAAAAPSAVTFSPVFGARKTAAARVDRSSYPEDRVKAEVEVS